MHDPQILQILQTHQKCPQDLDPIPNTHIPILPEIILQGHSLQILHRQIQRIPSLIHSKQPDNTRTIDPPHDLNLILNGHPSFSFEGDLLHECLDCYLWIFIEILSEVDTGEVAFSYFFDRLEEFMEVFACYAR